MIGKFTHMFCITYSFILFEIFSGIYSNILFGIYSDMSSDSSVLHSMLSSRFGVRGQVQFTRSGAGDIIQGMREAGEEYVSYTLVKI